jgi:hypothetical protein
MAGSPRPRRCTGSPPDHLAAWRSCAATARRARGSRPLQDGDQKVDVVQVLDPAPAGQTDSQGHGSITLLRAGVGCYGLQIDAPRFSKVLVVQFRS